MSDVSRYVRLAELREQARETEREYSEQAVGAVVDKVSDIGSAISKNAQDSFNRSMEAARKRREMEMQFAREGMTAGDLGRYAEESLAQAAGTAELQDYIEVGKNVVGAGMLTSTVAGVNEDE